MSQETRVKFEELRHDLQELAAQSESDILQLALARLDELAQCVDKDQENNRWFISHVSHELRVPLTSILGYTDLLRKGIFGSLTEQQLGFLTVIRNNVERMATLISDLSDLSKAEDGSLRLEYADIPLKPVIEEVVRNLQPLIAEKSQTLEVDLPGDVPQAHADYKRLVQVLSRLLNNASQYTPEAGKISLRVSLQPQALRFDVVDTGIGISPEDQARLFSQFFRSEHPYVREQPGWGLSLSVARALVEHMGGAVGVTSALGKGSAFWFTIPFSVG
jgi:signal transduction histidine kinase